MSSLTCLGKRRHAGADTALPAASLGKTARPSSPVLAGRSFSDPSSEGASNAVSAAAATESDKEVFVDEVRGDDSAATSSDVAGPSESPDAKRNRAEVEELTQQRRPPRDCRLARVPQDRLLVSVRGFAGVHDDVTAPRVSSRQPITDMATLSPSCPL